MDYLKEGLSCRDVAKIVPSVSHMTVSRILNTETGLPRPRAGRPHKLSDHAKLKVIRDISSGKIENAVIAAHELSEITRQIVYPENVRRVLGLKSIKKKKSRSSLQKKKLRKQRLDFFRNLPIGQSKILSGLYGPTRQKLFEWVPMG